MSKAAPEPVTLERLQRAQVFIAKLILRDGPVYAPYFDRLEREIEAMRSETDVMARARKIVEAQTTAGGANAIPSNT